MESFSDAFDGRDYLARYPAVFVVGQVAGFAIKDEILE